MTTHTPQIDEDTIDDLLYLARTGDLPQLQADLSTLSHQHNTTPIALVTAAVDSNSGNTLAHYACANGHSEILKYLISLAQPSTTAPNQPSTDLSHYTHLTRPNASLSTPLHYSALNSHLPAVKLLVEALPLDVRSAFVSAKNASGRDAAFEAECAGKEEVVTYLLGVLDEGDLAPSGEGMEGVEGGEGGVEGIEEDGGVDVSAVEGGVEGMNIGERD